MKGEGEVQLLKHALEEIAKHAEEAYPEEACGFLLSKKGEELVVATRRATNLKSGTRDRFEIPPKEIYEAERWAESNGMELVGFYHSHPDWPARPSRADAEWAWEGYLYLIISVREGRFSKARCFRWLFEEKRFEEVRMEVVER